MNSLPHIEQNLQDHLSSRRLVSSNTIWKMQTGGRSNHVWRLRGEEDLICKLYLDGSKNPLYANSPQEEFDCLTALKGAHCAPEAKELIETEFGTVLLYHYINGETWNQNAAAVADLLAIVHNSSPPQGLRELSGTFEHVADQGFGLLNKTNSGFTDEFRKKCPNIEIGPFKPVLIHTDVVPGNIVNGKDGLRLIDWQCPALGDPVVDVAMFLSPAMHLIYGAAPLPDFERVAFLDALPTELQQRYEAIGLLYHWRMAAYCLWRADQGQEGYLDAAMLEIALLK